MNFGHDRIRTAWRLAATALIFLACAGLARADKGTIYYVARETIADESLSGQLAQVGGAEARRVEIVLSSEGARAGTAHRIESRSEESANDIEICRALDSADVLVLRGGTFLDWYETLYHESGRTRLARSLGDFLDTEKPVIAYGGAAAFLSGGVSVPSADIQEVERNPRKQTEFQERLALRVGPHALFDSDDWEGGAPLRLLRAMHRTHVDLGLHFVGDVALRFSRQKRTLELLGPGAVLAMDLSRGKRPKARVQRARMQLWLRGDVWHSAFGRLVTAPAGHELTRHSENGSDLHSAPPGLAFTGPMLRDRLEQLAASHSTEPITSKQYGGPGVRFDFHWAGRAAPTGDEAAASSSEEKAPPVRRQELSVEFDCTWEHP